ncbi:acylneuraminate cytidylyltransferase family protein [bacterium]|nr:acylneuraminate cytidylyltransferase family protein [bacterium]
MKIVGFIPARGGSKSIKNKNIMELDGKPLIFYTLKACEEAESVEKVYVSTDSEEIKSAVEALNFKKAVVISRSPETATDTATSESALVEFCKNYEFEKVVFLQATSPLTTAKDIDGAVNKLEGEHSDSLISAVKNYQFLWNINGTPQNYNPEKRPRRQDWEGYFIENGAFYISSRKKILESNCRISGKISFWEMSQKTLYEVDEPSDWEIIKLFLK